MRKVTYKGRNDYRRFLSAARTIAGKISKADGVVGILATGGLGRGYCDAYSDLDLIVYAEAARVKELDGQIAVGWLSCKGISFDTPVESYDRARKHKSPSRYWSQVVRWDRQNSQILYDSRDRIRNLLEEKLVFPDWEQKRLLKRYSDEVAEHLVYLFETWEKRGTPAHLAHTLAEAAKYLTLWIYAKNKEFQPHIPKWLFYQLENHFVPESRYLNILKRPFTSSIRTTAQARRIRDDLMGVADRIGVRFKYRTMAEVFEAMAENWEKAPKITRRFLSW
jgi:hypothetical protein